MFVFLETLKEQIIDADESKIEDLAITAFATMEMINERLKMYLDNTEDFKTTI